MPAREPVLVANGQGFWGDSILGPVRLVREGPLHYLTLDYLAEVTMSIMQKLKVRNPNAGYATDFVALLDRILPECLDRGVKVIANAAGVNPAACLEAVGEVVKKHGRSGVRVGVIHGDDILPRIDELISSDEPLANMESGAPLSTIRDRVASANVYIGAFPLAEALAEGAQIVLAGRATDPSLVVAPLVHELGWTPGDWDRLAAGVVAGHIVECGAQCTGGNFSDWRTVDDFVRIGYPVVEAHADGSFVVTKHEGTGGLVTVETVTSQLLYEMGDPARYINPDVVADFTSIQLEQDGENRVRVSGIKGSPATDTYKVSVSYSAGWKASGQLTISGPDAIDKANLVAEIIFGRLALDGCEFSEEEKLIELVGTNVCHAGIVDAPAAPAEVVMRLGVRSPDRSKVDRFGMEIAPVITSGPPGVTGFAGGRPKATEIIAYWPALVGKDRIRTSVEVVEF